LPPEGCFNYDGHRNGCGNRRCNIAALRKEIRQAVSAC